MRTSAVTNAVTAAAIGLVSLRATEASSQDGDLDPTFGSSGTLTTSFGPTRQDQGYAVAVQPDGKVVVAGDSYHGSGYDIAVARYTELGDLDPSFGAGGRVLTPFPGTGASTRAVAIQEDGNIVVAGGTAGLFLVVRYTPDGALDPAFGAGGIVTTDFGGLGATAVAIEIQTDGKIVVAGRAGQTVNGAAKNVFALARYETDGALDATFGTGGLVTTSFGVFTNPGEIARALAIQPDGKIVVAGYTTLNDGLHLALARYQMNGALDPLFYGGGVLDQPGKIIGVARGTWANAVAVQTDGRILVGGGNRDGQFLLARFNTIGAPDLSFGSLGMVTTVLSPGLTTDEVFALVLQSDDKILATGLSHTGTDFDYGLARYETSGALDATFGTGGIVKTGIVPVTIPFTGGDYAQAAATTPDGQLVVAGYSNERQVHLLRGALSHGPRTAAARPARRPVARNGREYARAGNRLRCDVHHHRREPRPRRCNRRQRARRTPFHAHLRVRAGRSFRPWRRSRMERRPARRRCFESADARRASRAHRSRRHRVRGCLDL